MAKQKNLDGLRASIDTIDDKIHDLLLRRTDLVAQIGDLKRSQSVQGFPLRPAREAAMLRRLVARHAGPFPVTALVNIWRELLSGQIMVQSQLSIAVSHRPIDATQRHLARNHFGDVAKVRSFSSPGQVLKAVTNDEVTVGILPLPSPEDQNSWWTVLPNNDAVPPRIVARLPFLLQESRTDECPEVLVVAKVAPEPSGEDVSLLVIELREDIDGSQLNELLHTVGLTVDILTTCRDSARTRNILHLLAIGGFVHQGDTRLEQLVQSTDGLVTNITVAGAYAKQLHITD